MPRQYNKVSPYWENRKIEAIARHVPNITVQAAPVVAAQPVANNFVFPDIEYGETRVSLAGAAPTTGLSGSSSISSTRSRQSYSLGADPDAFANIRQLRLPWDAAGGVGTDMVSAKVAIELCARAANGIPDIRNAVEVSTEFSNQPLYVKCKNKTVKRFFEKWFELININKLTSEAFREYYRSGNVFIQSFLGKFGAETFNGMSTAFGAKENRIPIRYYVVNPTNVFVRSGTTFPHVYMRLLSTWEIERLRNPLTEQDKQVLRDLPESERRRIKNTGSFPTGLYVPINPDNLRFFFYKKQSYEPLATPMVWPVLPLIEWKLALQKADKALANTVELAILLVTTGEGPNQYNGGNGINQNNIIRLQNFLSNHAISRVLVADYSTKGQWLIPDLSGLGPQKYQVVNEDIRSGLQSILTGDDKFANAQIKAKIFIQRLEEGQKCFLNDFLMPEVRRICEDMGFRDIPKIGFQKINLSDESVFARVYSQLATLGLLTNEGVTNALNTGVLPDADEAVEQAQKFKELRDKGLFTPLTGGNMTADQGGRPSGTTGVKQTTKNVSPQGTKKGSSITDDVTEKRLSIWNIAACIKDSEKLEQSITQQLARKFGVKEAEFNDAQKNVVKSLSFTAMAALPRDSWAKDETAKLIVQKTPKIPASVTQRLDEIAQEYQVGKEDAVIIRESLIDAK